MYVSMTHVMKILVIFVTLPFGFKAKIMTKTNTKIMRSEIDRNYFFAIHMAPCVKDVNVILIYREVLILESSVQKKSMPDLKHRDQNSFLSREF